MREGPIFFFFQDKEKKRESTCYYITTNTWSFQNPSKFFQLSFPLPYCLPFPAPHKNLLHNSPPLIPRVSEPGPGLLLSRWWGPRGGKELRPGRPPRELLHRTPPRGPSRTRWGRGTYFPSLGERVQIRSNSHKTLGKMKPFFLKSTSHSNTHVHTRNAWLQLSALSHLKICPSYMFCSCRLMTLCVNPDLTNLAGASQFYYPWPMKKEVSQHCSSRCLQDRFSCSLI